MEYEVQKQAGDKLVRILIFIMVISSMTATMFTIVLPEIRVDYDLPFTQVSWVTSAYMLICCRFRI